MATIFLIGENLSIEKECTEATDLQGALKYAAEKNAAAFLFVYPKKGSGIFEDSSMISMSILTSAESTMSCPMSQSERGKASPKQKELEACLHSIAFGMRHPYNN